MSFVQLEPESESSSSFGGSEERDVATGADIAHGDNIRPENMPCLASNVSIKSTLLSGQSPENSTLKTGHLMGLSAAPSSPSRQRSPTQWPDYTAPPPTKITVRLVPIGSTAPVTPRLLQVSSDQTVAVLIRFVTKKLRLPTVYMYIHSSFQPTPDESLGDLYSQFRTNQELIVSYCHSVAFG